jgi:hypothetical protein
MHRTWSQHVDRAFGSAVLALFALVATAAVFAMLS